MIQQQYYTRERRGLYSTTSGYDSIAKSEGISDNFVKTILHPFCTYDAPAELVEKGEKNIGKYPVALTCFQTENGELVLGQAAFVGPDFTGIRNTFFVHNYIIPKEEKEEFIKNPSWLFHVKGFKTSYDIEEGMSIPEIPLEQIITREKSANIDVEGILKKLGVSEENYKKLLYALFSSITNRRKIYVSLDVEAAETPKYAEALLQCLLFALPYELRRNIGFSTYLKEPRNKRYINILFVEKGNIKLDDIEVKRGYVFDFSKEKFLNVDFDLSSEYYIHFLWNSLKNKNKIDHFYHLLDEMLTDAEPAFQLALETYNKAAYFYSFDEGNQEIYEKNKEAIFQYAYEFCLQPNVKQHKWMETIFKKMAARERNRIQNTLTFCCPKEIIKAFVEHYNQINVIQEEMSEILFQSILNAKKGEKIEYLCEIFTHLEKQTEVFPEIVGKMYVSRPLKEILLHWYMEQRMEAIKVAEELFEEMNFWVKTSPRVIEDDYFYHKIEAVIFQLLDADASKVLLGKEISEFLEAFKENILDTNVAKVDKIIRKLYEYVIEKVDLAKLTVESITHLDSYYMKAVQEYHLEIDEEKLDTLKCMAEVLQHSSKDINSKELFERVSNIPYFYREAVKQFIKNICKKEVRHNQFDKYIFAFVYYGSGDAKFNYEELFKELLAEYDEGKIIDFLCWYSDHMESEEKKYFQKVVRNYFITTEGEALKDKRIRERLFDTRRGSMYKEIEKELATGFKKFLMNMGVTLKRNAISFILIFITLAAVGAGAYFMKVHKDAEIAKEKEQKRVEFQNKSREIAKFSPEEQDKIVKEVKDGVANQIKLKEDEYAIDWEITYKDSLKASSVMTAAVNGEAFKVEEKSLFTFNEKVSEKSNFTLQGKAQAFVADQSNNNGTSEAVKKIMKNVISAHLQEKEKKIEEIRPKE